MTLPVFREYWWMTTAYASVLAFLTGGVLLSKREPHRYYRDALIAIFAVTMGVFFTL